RAVEIDAADDVSLRRPELQVPAEMEIAGDAVVRPAVDDLHEWPFLVGVEVRRIDDPHLHVPIAGAFEGNVVDLTKLPLRHEGIIKEADLLLLFRGAMGKARGRQIEAG